MKRGALGLVLALSGVLIFAFTGLARSADLSEAVFLVATSALDGSPFAQSVIITAPLPNEPIYLGGPQLLPAVFAVVRTAPEGNGTIVPLMPGLVAIIDGESVDRVIATTPNEARYFAGLMVWDDEDLYAQVKAQLWEVRPADVEAVFRAKAIGLWNALRGPTASLPDGLLPKQFG